VVVSRPARFIAGYTAALGVGGIATGLAAVLLYGIQGDEWARTIRLLAHLHALMAVACVLAAVLRHFGATSARAVTAVASILLIFLIPMGTAAFLWWLLRVRHQEAPPRRPTGP